jgi:hypothetical protein
MGTPNQVHEAARQIIENASDIHGALSLAGRFDLVRKVLKIQKKAACIIRLERPERSQADVVAGYRADALLAMGCLGETIEQLFEKHGDAMLDDEMVTAVRTAEVFVKRALRYFEAAAESIMNEEDINER